ncbi:discoidin domain-containing protein, partial [Planctomycetota bacterium]
DKLIEHDEDPETMWLSSEGREINWIEFDLGTVHELGSILVWNYNHRGHTDWGLKSADISVWTQDSGWQKVHDDFEFAEAEGSFDYDEPTRVTLNTVKAQKVRFDDLVGFGNNKSVGLSEVCFFENPDPDTVEPQ